MSLLECLLRQCEEPPSSSDHWLVFYAWGAAFNVKEMDEKILQLAQCIPKRNADIIAVRSASVLKRSEFESLLPHDYQFPDGQGVPRVFFQKLVEMPKLYQTLHLPEGGNMPPPPERIKLTPRIGQALTSDEHALVADFIEFWDEANPEFWFGANTRYVLLKAPLLPGALCVFDRIRNSPIYFQDLEVHRIICMKMWEIGVEIIEEYYQN